MMVNDDLTISGMVIGFIALIISFFFPIFFNLALLMVLILFIYHAIQGPIYFMEDHCESIKLYSENIARETLITQKLLEKYLKEIKILIKETKD